MCNQSALKPVPGDYDTFDLKIPCPGRAQERHTKGHSTLPTQQKQNVHSPLTKAPSQKFSRNTCSMNPTILPTHSLRPGLGLT